MSTPDQPTDARARLLAHFKGDPSSHGQKWDDLYKENFLPWDKGFPNPALVDLLSERQDLLPKSTSKGQSGKRLKALVPGCGKGYDVLLLAAFGYDAYGLEISSRALEAARNTEKEMAGKGVYETQHGVEKGIITWLAGDFFKDEFLQDVGGGDGKFDLIYDYTVSLPPTCFSDSKTDRQFLSALPPSLRPAWSKRFVELLAVDGRVVCIEFPTYKPPSTGGPPWALPPKVYMGHLPRPGEELSYSEDGDLQEQKLREPSKDGLKRIEHFQPKRTHEIGYNAEGRVTDWVSVWVHAKPSP